MGICGNCKYWDDSQWIMNKFSEGCGICKQDGQIRFCEHKCPFAIQLDNKYNIERKLNV